jgi:hypothetical protein
MSDGSQKLDAMIAKYVLNRRAKSHEIYVF